MVLARTKTNSGKSNFLAVAPLILLVFTLATSPLTPFVVDAHGSKAIVWDATIETGCVVSEETDGSKSVEKSCAPGSIIASSTDPEKVASGIGIVVDLTGDPAVDTVLIEDAILSYAPLARFSHSTCTAADRTINGRYNIGGGVQAYYTLNYKLRSDCLVYDVQDRGRADVGTFGFWKNSCSNGTSGCYARNMYLPVSFTPYYAVPDGYYGTQYRHTTAAGSTNYYGFWWYD